MVVAVAVAVVVHVVESVAQLPAGQPFDGDLQGGARVGCYGFLMVLNIYKGTCCYGSSF